METIKWWIYYNGFKFGIFMIVSPIVKDILFKDLREGSVAIGTYGVIVQIIGLILMFAGGRDSK